MQSPTLVGNISDSKSENVLQRTIGKCPVVTAKFGNTDVTCLVDSGSMVSSVTESFYRKYIESTGSVIKTDMKLNLKGANGLSVPYIGYVEKDIECMGTLLRDRGVLIVKDVEDEVTRRRKEQVPGILGMHVIRQCRDILFQDFGRGYQDSCAEISENSKM